MELLDDPIIARMEATGYPYELNSADITICEDCDNEIYDRVFCYNGSYYCEDCFKNKILDAAKKNPLELADEMNIETAGKEGNTCPYCNEVFSDEHSFKIENQFVCKHCFQDYLEELSASELADMLDADIQNY